MLEILSSNLVLPLLAVLASLVLLFYALPKRMPTGIQMTPWITVAALVWAVSDLSYLALPLLEQLPLLSAWFRSLGMDILPLASLLQILLLTEKIRWPNRGSLVLFTCTLLLEQGCSRYSTASQLKQLPHYQLDSSCTWGCVSSPCWSLVSCWHTISAGTKLFQRSAGFTCCSESSGPSTSQKPIVRLPARRTCHHSSPT
jgi:hypothetical protein